MNLCKTQLPGWLKVIVFVYVLVLAFAFSVYWVNGRPSMVKPLPTFNESATVNR